jgi:esterase/lipase superfamily enzyme
MRWLRLSNDEPLRIIERRVRDSAEFWTDISAELARCSEDERQALIFLHGYNNSFDDAAIRAAQIGFDLKVPGITGLFSWPSQGTELGYFADEASIEASEPAIAEFLADFVEKSGAQRIHLIAHSMGNRGLLRAIQRIVSRVSVATDIRFGHIILAAPDVDRAVFCDLARSIQQISNGATLYVSPRDRAVCLSRWLHRFSRAGLTPPVTVVQGIDTIEIPHLDLTDQIWHGYYAEATSVLHDMFDVLRANLRPDARQRLTAVQNEIGATYWVMGL